MDKTLFIFIDESGNFDFSTSGTKHFVMASVMTLEPIRSSMAMQELKYRILALGHDFSAFHASQDQPWVRDEAIRRISNTRALRAHLVFGRKCMIPERLQKGWKVHGLFARELLRFSSLTIAPNRYGQVVVILDRALTESQQKAFQLAMRRELKDLGRPFHVYFHPMNSDFNGQIADYLAWAKFRQLERGDDAPLKSLRHSIDLSEEEIQQF
jgi:hypothetical protein